MKKRSTIALICLLTAVILLFSACGSKSFEFDNITKIEVMNGNTGERVEIDASPFVINMFEDSSFKKGSSAADSTGWSYRLLFYQDDKLTIDITVLSETRISYNGYYYNIEDGTIDMGYLAEILETRIE